MSFSADEKLRRGSKPIELYDFVGSTKTYRLTSHTTDIVFMSNTYTRTAINRRSIQSSTSPDGHQLEIEMPISVAVVADYGFKSPPSKLTLTLTRYHAGTQNSRVMWVGPVVAISPEGNLAKVLSVSPLSAALEQSVPSKYYQIQCNHFLFDSRCALDRNSFKEQRTVQSVSADGLSITIDQSLAGGKDWAKGGEIVRDSDGERRLVLGNDGGILTIGQPFSELSGPDVVTIFAGCDHSLNTCDAKFANSVNFGGTPVVPKQNIFGIVRGVKGFDSGAGS